MNTTTAIDLITTMTYKPGWSIWVTDNTARFEGAVKLDFEYPAAQSERAEAAKGYPTMIQARASFSIQVANLTTETELARKVLNAILDIETHEAREFLRFTPTYWAPFHPHREDGMTRWGNPDHDLQFGLS